jgi:caffeoyl-CoA O-methyltransferase
MRLKTVSSPLRLLCVAAFCSMLLVVPLQGQSAYSPAFEQRVQGVIAELGTPENERQFSNVPSEDARILRLVVRLTKAQRAVEVGTSNGYSSLWLGLGLMETGGRLTTIEIDPERHRLAQANIEKAGLTDIITAVQGDAATVLPTLKGPFDVAFVDVGDGDLSRKFLDMILPQLRVGGVIMVHAVRYGRNNMAAFVDYIQQLPQLDTFIIPITRPGIALSYKVK